jgi:hypothetical protein
LLEHSVRNFRSHPQTVRVNECCGDLQRCAMSCTATLWASAGPGFDVSDLAVVNPSLPRYTAARSTPLEEHRESFRSLIAAR